MAPADRAAILLCEQGVEECSSVYGLDRHGPSAGPVQVSRTIVARVLAEGVAVLCNDLTAAETFDDAESVAARQIRSVLAVPLEVFDRVMGSCTWMPATRTPTSTKITSSF